MRYIERALLAVTLSCACCTSDGGDDSDACACDGTLVAGGEWAHYECGETFCFEGRSYECRDTGHAEQVAESCPARVKGCAEVEYDGVTFDMSGLCEPDVRRFSVEATQDGKTACFDVNCSDIGCVSQAHLCGCFPLDCQSACEDFYACGLESGEGGQFCPGFGDGAGKIGLELFLQGSANNGCLAFCAHAGWFPDHVDACSCERTTGQESDFVEMADCNCPSSDAGAMFEWRDLCDAPP